MTEQEVLQHIEAVLRGVLGRDDISVTKATTAGDVDGWDSLTNMTIVAKIEDKFGCKFKFREIVKFRNIGDLCEAILIKVTL